MTADYLVSYAQNREDIILNAFFHKFQHGFYVDVGANDPTEHSVTKFFYDREWSGINVEPIPRLHRKLVVERPRDINLNIGLSDQPGQLRFREYQGDGLSTFSSDMMNDYQLAGSGDTPWATGSYKDYTVEVKTLAMLFEEHAIAEVSFLKVDVEGYEYAVLAGNDWMKYRPMVICIEATHIRTEWRHILTGADYRLCFFDGLNEYYVAAEHESLADEFDYTRDVIGPRIVQYDVQQYLTAKVLRMEQLTTGLLQENTGLRTDLHYSRNRPLESLLHEVFTRVDAEALRRIAKLKQTNASVEAMAGRRATDFHAGGGSARHSPRDRAVRPRQPLQSREALSVQAHPSCLHGLPQYAALPGTRRLQVTGTGGAHFPKAASMTTRISLVVDCQVLQLHPWHRGVGKYTFDLLKALHDSGSVGAALVFSRHSPRNAQMREELRRQLPRFEAHDLDLQVPRRGPFQALQLRNRRVLDRFLGQRGLDSSTVRFLLPSLFHWPACPSFPSRTANVVLMYDLIPLLYFERYEPSGHYLSQFRLLFAADHILTISDSVSSDLQVHLGLEPSRVTSIGGAAAVRRGEPRPDRPVRNDIHTPYVLMPSGDDQRKNNRRAVEAFERFRSQRQSDVQLVITSFFRDETKEELNQISPSLRFTGNIPNDEIAALYERCRCVLFVPEAEGLGLPVLEAVDFERPLACSDIPPFREISPTAFHMCDPHSVESIGRALFDAFQRPLDAAQRSEYLSVADRYTWAKTAATTLGVLRDVQAAPKRRKPKLAVLGPNPSGYSAVGKVMADLHPSLSRHYDVHYFLADSDWLTRTLRPGYLQHVAPCHSVHDFNAKVYAEYDAVVYHLGNSEYHVAIAQHALTLPGIAILHDTHLPNVYRFLSEWEIVPKERLELEQRLNDSMSSSYISSLVNGQLGVVVHSDFAGDAVRAVLTNRIALQRANLTSARTGHNSQDVPRERLQVGLGGILAGVKGLALLEAVSADAQFADAVIHVFGFNFAEPELVAALQQLPQVRVATDLTDLEFHRTMSSLDILLNYRLEYRGEASLTTLQALSYGVVPIVRGIGWYAELPDDCVAKVGHVDDVLPTLKSLAADAGRRRAMAQAGMRLISEQFLPEHYTKDLRRLLDDVAERRDLTRRPLADAVRRGLPVSRLMQFL